MADPAVRIELANQGRSVRIRALNIERLTHHGFGTFLQDIRIGEISISQEALDALLRCRHRYGLQGMEIFANHTIGWVTRQPKVTIDLSKVSRGPETEWFRDYCVVERELSAR